METDQQKVKTNYIRFFFLFLSQIFQMYQACDHQKYQRLLKTLVGKLSSWSNTEIQRRHHKNCIFDNSASSQHMESLTVAQMIVFPVCSASASRCSLSDLDWQCLSTSCIAPISGMEMVNVGVCFTAHLMLCVCAVVFCILRHNSFSLIINNLIAISHPHMQIKSQIADSEKQEVFLLHPADQAEPIDLPWCPPRDKSDRGSFWTGIYVLLWPIWHLECHPNHPYQKIKI